MPTDYEQLAPGYDKRYRDRSYAGVERALIERLAGIRGAVVEVGCGTGQWLSVLRARGVDVLGIDLSRAMLQQARQRAAGRLLHGCAAHLPLQSGSCGALYCVNAAHHFPDKAAFVHEAARVLAPGGRLLVISLEPQRGDDDWVVYDYWPETRAHDLARYASHADWQNWCSSVGLRLVEYGVAEHLVESRSAEQLLSRGAELKQSTSQLADLDQSAFAAGLARIREAAARCSADAPLILRADLRLRLWLFAK